MKKTRILSIMASAVAVVALLTGCSTENDLENGKDGLASLELSSVSSSDMLTRAVIDGTTFPQTGEIGLFLFKDELAETPYGESGYTNIKYAYNSSKNKWTASPAIKVGSTPGHLYGYYPYNAATLTSRLYESLRLSMAMT
ncbi:MAG: fimbrillin family protein [Bacteroidales bacterium]|nr:fimbrillin family protein [Bacteroidales bacterium]